MAGTVASERQLTGIINSDDSFKVGKSVDRLSSLDPKRYRRLPVGWPTSRTGLLGTASRSARILKVVRAGSASRRMRPAEVFSNPGMSLKRT